MQLVWIGITLFWGVVVGFCFASEDSAEDGYALYLKACDCYGERADLVSRDINREIKGFAVEGQYLSPRSIDLLAQFGPCLEFLEEASKVASWAVLPVEQQDFNNFPSWGMGHWHDLRMIVRAKLRLLLNEGDFEGCYSLLQSMNAVGLELWRGGGDNEMSNVFLDRALTSLAWTEVIKSLPQSKLEELLKEDMAQFAALPNLESLLRAEGYRAKNEVAKIFRKMGEDESLLKSRRKAVSQLRKSGKNKEEVTRFLLLESGPEVWSNKVFRVIDERGSWCIDSLPGAPMDDLPFLEEEYQSWWIGIDDDTTIEVALSLLKISFKEFMSGKVTLNDLKSLDEKVGRAIASELLKALLPSEISHSVIMYNSCVTYEKLRLVAIASRLFELKSGHPPLQLKDLVEGGLLEHSMILDPMSGSPFLLMTGEPLRAYSVGGDLDDDQGGSGDIMLKIIGD